MTFVLSLEITCTIGFYKKYQNTGSCNLSFLKNTQDSVNNFQIEGEKSCDYFLINIYIKIIIITDKVLLWTLAILQPLSSSIDHATKTKDLIGSFQTLLFINQSKPTIL